MQFKKCFIIYISFLLIPVFPFAQQIKTSLAALQDKKFENNILVRAGNKIIGYEYRGEWENMSVELIQYDTLMNELKRISLSNGKKMYDKDVLILKKVAGKLYFIYQPDADKKGPRNIMSMEVNPETLALSEPKMVAPLSETGKRSNYGERNFNYPVYMIGNSNDETKLGLLFPGAGNSFYVSVLDENMNIVWTRELDTKGYKETYLHAICVDNNKNAYVAYRVIYQTKASPNERTRVAVYTPDSKIYDNAVDLGQDVSKQIFLLQTKNKSIHAFGYYHDDHEFSNIIGMFHCEVSTQNNFAVSNIKKQAFTDSFVARIAKDDWADMKPKKYGLLLNQIWYRTFEMEDGSVALISEFHDAIGGVGGSSIYTSGGIVYYHFGLAQFTFSYIPKFRKTAGMYNNVGDTYNAIPVKDKMYILYNDNADNLKKDITESPYRSSNYAEVVMLVAIVGAEGSVERKLVEDQKADNFISLPEYMIPQQTNSVLVPMVKVRGIGGAINGTRWVNVSIN